MGNASKLRRRVLATGEAHDISFGTFYLAAARQQQQHHNTHTYIFFSELIRLHLQVDGRAMLLKRHSHGAKYPID
jgi:hypothetical protein